jgi:hypothetical protein
MGQKGNLAGRARVMLLNEYYLLLLFLFVQCWLLKKDNKSGLFLLGPLGLMILFLLMEDQVTIDIQQYCFCLSETHVQCVSDTSLM